MAICVTKQLMGIIKATISSKLTQACFIAITVECVICVCSLLAQTDNVTVFSCLPLKYTEFPKGRSTLQSDSQVLIRYAHISSDYWSKGENA